MNMELRWDDLVAYFGNEMTAYRRLLSQAGQSTHALLACRAMSDEAVFVSRDGDHAEEWLVRSNAWTRGLVQALERWTDLDSPMLVLLALNRSPCGHCARVLARALHALHNRFALRVPRQHFILASLGYYQGAGFPDAPARPRRDGSAPLGRLDVTTQGGLDEMLEAGWRLCVLEFDGGRTARGKELAQSLRWRG